MGQNPPLQGELLLRTQVELVSSTTAAATFYGIAFALYCLYLHVSFPQLPDHGRRRQAQFMITCSTVIMASGFYYLVANAWVIQDAYIKHRDFPGGPFVYEDSTLHTQPVIDVGVVCQSAIDILTTGTQIWRLWVVWSGARYARLVVILPLLSFLGFTALEVGIIVLDIMPTNSSLITSLDTNLATAGLALRGTAIILSTILIAGFLIFESRRQSKLTGRSQVSSLYKSVVAMVVESYALESTWAIFSVILYSMGSSVGQFFTDTLTYIEIIAYLLVLYRLGLATRRAYGTQRTYGLQAECQNRLSSVHWNHNGTQSCVTEVTNIDV